MDWLEAERDYDDEVIGMTTLGRLFEDAAERYRNRPAQRYKGGVYDRSLWSDETDGQSPVVAAEPGGFRALSYAEMREVVRGLAAGFRDLGLEGGDRVAIVSNTRMEWAQTDFALLAAGCVVTTVYPGSSPDGIRYLLDDPGATAVVTEDAALTETVLSLEDDLETDLSFVASIDRLPEEPAFDREDVLTLGDVYVRGASAFDADAYESWVDAPAVDDLASLIYTSGTTGTPKGVELTHRNFRSNVNQIRKRFGPRPDRDPALPSIDETMQTVSYLPLAHVFERLAGHFIMFASGACVAYAESPDTLQEDFSAVSPTAATSVPRVYEKIYDAVREQASESSVKQRIFEWATAVGREHYESDDPGAALRAKHRVADRLVFSQVREALGGNVELLISGGGSLSAELCTLYHAMGLPIYEGYGLTETAPVVTVNPIEEPKVGTIGPPLPDLEIEIDESVVDREAFDDPGRVGELLVRGPNVARGYWNKPGPTARAFTDEVPAREADGGTAASGADGRWFRTGDVVHLRPDGYVEFRERSKQLLVLSTGKNVAPGPIEDAFATTPVVEQCMVIGDEEKFVAALIVPNTDHVREWASAEGIDLPDDPGAMVEDERVHAYVASTVDQVNEAFEPHERIKQFRLIPQEFTEENEMLTPTMKKKRRVILQHFSGLVDDIYAE
ncbi:AMP-dependent synthetase/ligase [Natronobiforma cellulositropha]|uniref:AMP-dependent synthetase/ligase n=1 Tax=Natronobiforma cellulositropha TaxID=1679076 RepID=UPI0021D5FA27|nr:long-chain fatty acid--CoA ligase [Natronobiforma cellulositropha]